MSLNGTLNSINNIDDGYIFDKCNAILHCEARVDRIMKRYKKYQQLTSKIETQVQRACLLKREHLQEENLKPPKSLEELRKDNQNLDEILNKEPNYDMNKKQRVLDTMKKKYQKVWSKVHVPELTNKFKALHSIHFK